MSDARRAADLPPTTLMTGSTSQGTLDAVDLAIGVTGNTGAVHARLGWLSGSILSFAVGCAASALLYWLVGFWCLAVPTIVAAVAVLLTVKATQTQ